MKKIMAITAGLTVTLLAACSNFSHQKAETAEQPSVNVMSFNIRNSKDGATKDGINNWDNRKDRVADQFRELNIDIAGLQEAYNDQVMDLEKSLPEYGWTGIGRDDGLRAGEYSPIFYKKDQYELTDSGTFWLSETPNQVCSVGWDAALCRIASWGKFKTRADGNEFLVINAHFDHKGVEAREESAQLLVNKADELAKGLPVVITGDFNFTPAEKPYRILTQNAEGQNFTDTRTHSESIISSVQQTYHGFGKENPERDYIIDFIFVNDRVESETYQTFEDVLEKGIYLSDHYPVISTIKFKG